MATGLSGQQPPLPHLANQPGNKTHTMRTIFTLFCFLISLAACRQNDAPSGDARFRLLSAAESGIDFSNDLLEDPDMNIINYLYFYNGGGVATGDLNGDGLPDIYFTANQNENKLYLNMGGLKFKDITEIAGVAGQPGWTTGVTMADVNGDGKLDIYVSQLGEHRSYRGKNQLYINLGNDENGVPVFENQAEQYGLDLVGYATQAAFFDYDLDGDLDMYMLNHSVHNNGTFGKRKRLKDEFHPRAGDKLMRNEGGFFKDVTQEAGIQGSVIGYGLGLSIGDINMDGYPDIYVGNDFHENDYLYLNNGDGTFREVLDESIMHTSRFSMGTDIGDLNGDGFPEIMSLDMLPSDPFILKASAAEDAFDIFHLKLREGYNHQYARNTLQLNQGFLPHSPSGVRFSEVGLQSGVAATDWSWSLLFSDLDNDGRSDIFISNGILRRSNDLDYINFMTVDSVQARLKASEMVSEQDMKIIEKMPTIKLRNAAFQNQGDMTFQDRAEAWGFTQSTYSNGTAYADLDNDGDLDMVINNVNERAFVYENRTANSGAADANYLSVVTQGEAPNTQGIGAKVMLRTASGLQYREVFATRGYQSAVDVRPHFGVGSHDTIAEVTVIWPDGRFQVLRDVPANQQLRVKQGDATGKFDYLAFRKRSTAAPLFQTLPLALRPSYQHEENLFFEFNREALIPHAMSSEGPALAVGDANGDGLDDFYAGGAKWQAGALYLQQRDGSFALMPQPDFVQDSLSEDIDAAWLDVDGDGDLDLIVVSGGNEFDLNSPANLPRLYLNDGTGKLRRAKDQLPDIKLTASCVLVSDLNGDGAPDLFIGGRAVPSNYGVIPNSCVLINDGKGQYTDATARLAPALSKVGLVQGGAWMDINGDGRDDLVLACEWSPVRIFVNEAGGLRALSPADTGLAGEGGWWNNIIPGDMDGDGDMDFIAGNLGWNSKLQTTPEKPVRMLFNDFDGDGRAEQLLLYYLNGEENLFATKDEVATRMVSLKKRYLGYADFAKAKLKDIFPADKLKEAVVFEAPNFSSAYYENLGNGRFKVHPLPAVAQHAPIKSGIARDVDGDGILDLLLFGNFYEANIQRGRYDASYGLLLKGDGKGGFVPQTIEQSGICVPGQSRRLRALRRANGKDALLIARNNEGLVLIGQD